MSSHLHGFWPESHCHLISISSICNVFFFSLNDSFNIFLLSYFLNSLIMMYFGVIFAYISGNYSSFSWMNIGFIIFIESRNFQILFIEFFSAIFFFLNSNYNVHLDDLNLSTACWCFFFISYFLFYSLWVLFLIVYIVVLGLFYIFYVST